MKKMPDVKRIYLAGKITGDPNYREKFRKKTEELRSRGYTVMNPAVLPDGFEYEDYLTICFAMLDACDTIYFLDDYHYSPGANREQIKAVNDGKNRIYMGRFLETNTESYDWVDIYEEGRD